jgi:hypothetical protein
MADGTMKSGYDLQVGDEIKTIDIPNPENINNASTTANYLINMETFLDGVVYSTNKVTSKRRIDVSVETAQITFTDGTDWFDTVSSSYLIYENNEIQFKRISELVAGNILLLVDTSDTLNVQITQKTVQSVDVVGIEFSGWIIGVEREHLFLTSTANSTSNSSFVSIEHNYCDFDWQCPKGQVCNNNFCIGLAY